MAPKLHLRVGMGKKLCMFGLLWILSPQRSPQSDNSARGLQVLKLIKAQCSECHEDFITIDKKTGREAFSEAFLKENVVPGDPDNSNLIWEVTYDGMPKGKPKLSKDEMQLLKDWIKKSK